MKTLRAWEVTKEEFDRTVKSHCPKAITYDFDGFAPAYNGSYNPYDWAARLEDGKYHSADEFFYLLLDDDEECNVPSVNAYCNKNTIVFVEESYA